MKKRSDLARALVIELILTACVCGGIVLMGAVSVSDHAAAYVSGVEAGYDALQQRYISVFKAMTIHVRETIESDLSAEDMQAWLQSHDGRFKDAVGADIYDGFAMTYKGVYVHSWNYGDYTGYDPNTRVWYQEAARGGGQPVIVAPYRTYLGAEYLSSDQYIEMTIAQKYSDTISFDLDLKIKDINALLANRTSVYAGTTGLFFDKDGFILSTSNEGLYNHNVNTADSAVSAGFVRAMQTLKAHPGTLRLLLLDGRVKAAYSAVDDAGNTYCVLIPFHSAFGNYILGSAGLFALLAVLEVILYRRSRQAAEEAEARKAMAVALDDANAAARSKSEFLARMSHDIRTPMNGIIGMTHIARKQDNPPETEACLDKIDVSSQFLLGLVNDILDMSKAESDKIELHPEPYPFDEFLAYVDAIIRPLCAKKDQSFTLEREIAPDCVPLMDELRINQVFFNLLSNAVKYTPAKGRILLSMDLQPAGDHRCTMDAVVSDNGVGMSPGLLKVIFDPFTQGERSDTDENRGTGLGLAIVKKMMDRMGGTIAVESVLGAGTTFRLQCEFPCIPAAEAAEIRSGKRDGSGGKTGEVRLDGRRVLVCEDQAINQQVVKYLLSDRGMTAETAANGKEGLERFAASPEGYYDLILMDIRMPVMNGLAAARAIRALDRPDAGTVPIIATTANAFDDDVRESQAAGMDGHVAKPIDPDALYSALRRALALRGGKSQASFNTGT